MSLRYTQLKGLQTSSHFVYTIVKSLYIQENLKFLGLLTKKACKIIKDTNAFKIDWNKKLQTNQVIYVNLCYSLSIEPVRPIIGMTV